MHDQTQHSRRGVLGLGLGLGVGALVARPARAEEQQAPLVVYAVRHAEKGKGRDPQLTEAGAARAAELVRLLKDVPLAAVYSTATKRTHLTAAPVAEAHGLKVATYKPGTLGKQLKAGEGGSVLVVGHSNTTPDLIRELGGKLELKLLPGYDALMVATVIGGTTLVQHLHVGPESTESGH